MPRFEVYIPPGAADFPTALTLRVTSENWLAALKVGLQKTGGAQVGANILCDMMEDGSVEVTDPGSGKVFRIIEIPALTPVGLGPGVLPPSPAELAAAAAQPAPPPPAPLPPVSAPPRAAAAPPPPAAPARPSAAPAPSAAPPRAPAAAPAAPQARVSAAPPRPAAPPPAASTAPAARPAAPKVVQVDKPLVPPPARRIGRTPQQLHREEVLGDVFLRVPRVHELKKREDALGFLLELAMEKIACEAGFVLLARGGALAFAVARGVKAAEVLRADIRIPVGTGITGFCAQEQVGLAVSDVGRDPRFFSQISRAVGYETKSILCSPMVKAGRVWGVVELKNKKGTFDPADQAVLAYVAHQAAELLELREAAQPL